jgi:hypothetical protein
VIECFHVLGMIAMLNALHTHQADLAFGHGQVVQFTIDRPGTDEIIDREPALRELLAACFAGAFNGQRVYWDCHEPISGRPAEESPPYHGYPPTVLVTNAPSISSVDKCAMLAFELQNARSDDHMATLMHLAQTRQIGREDFARTCIRYEYQSTQKVQDFFGKHPIALADDASNPHYCAYMNMREDFPTFLQRLKDGTAGFSHWNYYLRHYDNVVGIKRSSQVERYESTVETKP